MGMIQRTKVETAKSELVISKLSSSVDVEAEAGRQWHYRLAWPTKEGLVLHTFLSQRLRAQRRDFPAHLAAAACRRAVGFQPSFLGQSDKHLALAFAKWASTIRDHFGLVPELRLGQWLPVLSPPQCTCRCPPSCF